MLSRPPARLASSTSARTAASIEVAPARMLAICSSSSIVVSPSRAEQEDVAGAGRRRSARRPRPRGSGPSARVMIERCGWSSACASVSWPLRRISSTSEWSRVSRSSLPSRKPVGAAVADVADRDLVASASTIAAVIVVPIPAREESFAGELVDLAVGRLDRLLAGPLRRPVAASSRVEGARRRSSRRPRRPGRRPSRRRRRRPARGRRRSPRWRCAGGRCRCEAPGRRLQQAISAPSSKRNSVSPIRIRSPSSSSASPFSSRR